MAAVIKEVVKLAVIGKQFLSRFNGSKLLCFSFPPSYRNMKTFGSIILATSGVLQMF